MADVSQFIHMQRLLAIEARRPERINKMNTHLFQPQILSSALTEFLPNPKTKITGGGTFRRQYISGIHAKPKLPARNAY